MFVAIKSHPINVYDLALAFLIWVTRHELHQWIRTCLPFRYTWVFPQFIVGFVLLCIYLITSLDILCCDVSFDFRIDIVMFIFTNNCFVVLICCLCEFHWLTYTLIFISDDVRLFSFISTTTDGTANIYRFHSQF